MVSQKKSSGTKSLGARRSIDLRIPIGSSATNSFAARVMPFTLALVLTSSVTANRITLTEDDKGKWKVTVDSISQDFCNEVELQITVPDTQRIWLVVQPQKELNFLNGCFISVKPTAMNAFRACLVSSRSTRQGDEYIARIDLCSMPMGSDVKITWNNCGVIKKFTLKLQAPKMQAPKKQPKPRTEIFKEPPNIGSHFVFDEDTDGQWWLVEKPFSLSDKPFVVLRARKKHWSKPSSAPKVTVCGAEWFFPTSFRGQQGNGLYYYMNQFEFPKNLKINCDGEFGDLKITVTSDKRRRLARTPMERLAEQTA